MIPFNQPHDHERAGLRDYYTRPHPDEPFWPRAILVTLLLAGIVVMTWFLAGCRSSRFVPEPPHPSAERLHELLDAPVTVPTGHARPLTLVLTPRVVLAGAPLHLRCLVPDDTRATVIGYGVAGVRTSTRPIDGAEYDLDIARVPCGDWTAYCALAREGSVFARVDQPLTADCS